MSEELKPCPFCDGKADYRTIGNCVYIKCINCGCTTQTYHYKEKNYAINAWNRRHSLWHTGTPTEDGWYLVEIDGYPYAPYHVCSWMDNEWYYTDVFFKDAPVIRWLLISTKESRRVNRK